MSKQRNRVVRLTRYGAPENLIVANMPLPVPGPREVRVQVLASGLEYTDTLIRRHIYPQTWLRRPPFPMGYDLVGEIDQVGTEVSDFRVGDRVAAMTVVGANADYCVVRADLLTRVPSEVDPAEAAALILSWTTAYQLLHRVAHVETGQQVLVHGAGGAVGQALLVLGRLAGLRVWGAARGKDAALIEQHGATFIDYDRQDFTTTLHCGFDVIFDGIGEDGFRRSLAALRPGGRLYAIGYSWGVQKGYSMLVIMMWIARLYLSKWKRERKRAEFFSINATQALHPRWFQEDLGCLLHLLAKCEIQPRIARRVSFEDVVEAHRQLEAGGLDGKLVLCTHSARQ